MARTSVPRRHRRRRASLRSRVLLSLAVMLLPVVALGLAAAYAFDAAVSRLADAAAEAEREAIPLARLPGSIRTLERPAHAAYFGEARGVRDYEDAVARSRRHLGDARRDLVRDDGSERLLDRARRSLDDADRELRRLLGEPLAIRTATGVRGLAGVDAALATAAAASDDAEAHALARRHDTLLTARDAERRTLVLLAAACLAGFGVAVLAARRLGASVLGPVRLLRAGAVRLGAGDLSHRVDLEQDDEMGDLAAAFDAMAAALQRSQDELAFRALHDPLTGLPNRALLRDRLDHALTALARRQERVGLLMVDLDDFKAVNDRRGHLVGDRVLVATASRIASSVREADTPARLGGDEFAVLLEGVAGEDGAVEVARRLCDALASPLRFDDGEVSVAASIGVAVAAGGATADELLRAADVALYRAKDAGGGRVERQTPAVTGAGRGTCPSVGLGDAIARGELHVTYRPVVALDSGRLREVTALPCWSDRHRGLLTGDDLPPVAARTPVAGALTAWLLEASCAQLAQWTGASSSGTGLRLGVSLSSAQLADADLVETVGTTMRRYLLAPARLVVGVSERSVVEHGETGRARLADLRRLGVQVAVEGFGTGYSSLADLRRTPVDRLAVDASFVEGISRPGVEGTVAEAVVSLARSLRLEAVAEGVAEGHQLAALLAAGCRLGWGPRFASSLEPAEVAAVLVADRPVRRPAPALA